MVAARHLILPGIMDAYPRLKVLLAYSGGALHYPHRQLNRSFKTRPEIIKVILKLLIEYLQQFYFDTIAHDANVLCGSIEFAGADHVLLGLDYPFDMGNTNPVDCFV